MSLRVVGFCINNPSGLEYLQRRSWPCPASEAQKPTVGEGAEGAAGFVQMPWYRRSSPSRGPHPPDRLRWPCRRESSPMLKFARHGPWGKASGEVPSPGLRDVGGSGDLYHLRTTSEQSFGCVVPVLPQLQQQQQRKMTKESSHHHSFTTPTTAN